MAAAPIQRFNKSMERVRRLADAHVTLHGHVGRPSQQATDVLRSALVLAFAALDALITDLIVGLLPELLRSGSTPKAVETWVKEHPNLAVKSYADGDPAAALTASVEKETLLLSTYQKVGAINSALQSFLGTELSWDAIATEVNARGLSHVTWTEADVWA